MTSLASFGAKLDRFARVLGRFGTIWDTLICSNSNINPAAERCRRSSFLLARPYLQLLQGLAAKLRVETLQRGEQKLDVSINGQRDCFPTGSWPYAATVNACSDKAEPSRLVIGSRDGVITVGIAPRRSRTDNDARM